MLSIWNPFTPVLSNAGKSDNEMSIKNYFDRLFEQTWHDAFLNFDVPLRGIEYIKTDDKLSVNIDLPGVKDSDILVNITDNIVTVKAERKTKTQSSKIEKSFSIPTEYNLETLEANLHDGVLTISVDPAPKIEKTIKKIEVKSLNK